MLLNPTQASEKWGIGKSTLYRAMNQGDVSYTRDQNGKRQIDTSEMLRVFGEPREYQDESKDIPDTSQAGILREMLERQDKAHAELIKAMKERIESQEKQIAVLTESLNNTTLLLSHGREKAEQASDDVIHVAPKKAEEKKQLKQVSTVAEPKTVQQQAKRKSLLGRLLQAAIDS